MLVSLDDGTVPPIKYQYAELSKLYAVVSQLVRCCDVSEGCHSSYSVRFLLHIYLCQGGYVFDSGLCDCVQNIAKGYKQILIFSTKNAYMLETNQLAIGENPDSFVDSGSFFWIPHHYQIRRKVTFCSASQKINLRWNVMKLTGKIGNIVGNKRNSFTLAEVCTLLSANRLVCMFIGCTWLR